MPSFSRSSLRNLSGCHTSLQYLFKEVIKHYDCTIISGYRTDNQQQELFLSGASKKRAGESKHNNMPSLAVDVAPWQIKKPHIDWQCHENFRHFAGFVMGVASQLEIDIRWGGSWDCSNDARLNKFNDLGHFELK